jgi:NADH:ubiquinone oxidoreductase subunit 3 (subunit A)
MTSLVASLLLFVAVGVGFIFVHLVAGKLLRPNKPGAEKGTIYECGEPTIGSAWIQFDLRFYVVALLFVIFDVEVAFFFPWAEVFGKSNAVVADLPGKSFAQIKEISQRGRELVPNHGDKGMTRDLMRYLGDMNESEYETLKQLVKRSETYTKYEGEEKAKADKEKNRQAAEKIRANIKPYRDVQRQESLAALEKMRKDRNLKSIEELLDSPETASESRPHFALLSLSPQEFDEFQMTGSPFRESQLKEASTLSQLALVEILLFFGILLVGFAYLWRRGDLAWVRALQAPQVPPAEGLIASAPEPAPEVVTAAPSAVHH